MSESELNMNSLLYGKLHEVEIPIKEVKSFMNNLEKGAVNLGKSDFYMNKKITDEFEHI